MQILFWKEMLCLDVVRLNLSLISQTVHIDTAVFPVFASILASTLILPRPSVMASRVAYLEPSA